MSSAFLAPEFYRSGTRAFAADVFSPGAIFSMMSTVISGDSLEEFEESRLRRKQGDYLSHGFYLSFSVVETWLMQRQLGYNELIVKMLSV